MSRARPRRGQPVAALALVLGGWVAMRVMLWDAVATEAPGHSHASDETPHRELAALNMRLRRPQSGEAASGMALSLDPHRDVLQPVPAPAVSGPFAHDIGSASMPSRATPSFAPSFAPPPTPPSPAAPLVPAASRSGSPVAMAAGHQLLWMAAVSQMPLPADLLSGQASAAPRSRSRPPRANPRRWSADGWLLLRRGSASSLAASGSLPSYGASQTGMVVRYRLAPASPYRPAVYLRATAALNGSSEKVAALGLQARLLPRLPIVAAAEVRLASQSGGTRLHPAALVYSEFPVAELPLGLRGEAYAQAGYVGGRDATAFADGQLRLDRRIARGGAFELRAGAGVWAGAQKGAARVDAGPTASLGATVPGGGALRLGLDWRFRLAGNAVPASGPALTLSAGF